MWVLAEADVDDWLEPDKSLLVSNRISFRFLMVLNLLMFVVNIALVSVSEDENIRMNNSRLKKQFLFAATTFVYSLCSRLGGLLPPKVTKSALY